MGQSKSNRSGGDEKPKANLGFRSWFLIWQNVIGALLSVPMLVTGILVARENRGGSGDCATFMNKPIIAMGALLLIVSLVGLVAAIFDKVSNHPAMVWFHLLLMFCLVTILFCFSIFCLEITNKGLGHNVNGYGQSYKEYRLYEYPKWMRQRIENVNYWSKVRYCLQGSSLCDTNILPYIFTNFTYNSLTSLTPIQRGCCIPPSACNITYLGVLTYGKEHKKKENIEEKRLSNQHGIESKTVEGNKIKTSTTLIVSSSVNATRQENRYDTTKISKNTLEGTINTNNNESINYNAMDPTLHAYTHDCKHWNIIPQQLCYACDTCKAGVLQDSMDRWKNAAILYVVLVMIMIFLYALFACYGFEENPNKKTPKLPIKG